MKKFFFSLYLGLLLGFSTGIDASVVLKDLAGAAISFEALNGKWVFINYWATWCGPCVDEIAEFNRFYQRHHSAKVAVFAVNFDAPSIQEQQDMAHHFHIHYPSLNPSSLRPLHLARPTVVPVTYVFDPAGHLHTTLYGGQTQASLLEAMKG